jgi:hypothetical protein
MVFTSLTTAALVDCDEFTAARSTCTAVAQELYTQTTTAANGGTACTGSSTLCVDGDIPVVVDCHESTAPTSSCTAVGQQRYTRTTAAANGGTACTGWSALCVEGDIPVPCVESTAARSTCTAIDQELYTVTTAAANGGTACTGSSTKCVEGDIPNGDGAAVDGRMCLSADTTGDDAVNVQDLMTVLANFGCTIEECGHPCGQLHDYQAVGR